MRSRGDDGHLARAPAPVAVARPQGERSVSAVQTQRTFFARRAGHDRAGRAEPFGVARSTLYRLLGAVPDKAVAEDRSG